MRKSGKVPVWIGRVLTALAGLLFLMSAVMKFMGGKQVDEGMAHLGLSESLILPLALLELACVVIYLIPQTAVLGAILLTGYTGGVILSHLRVGDPFIVPIILGIVVWLGVALRDARLWSLVPFRRSSGLTDPANVA